MTENTPKTAISEDFDQTGGPAYPNFFPVDHEKPINNENRIPPGMTLWDHFAGQALQGYLASVNNEFEPAEFAGSIARDCGILADAMIAERRARFGAAPDADNEDGRNG